MPGARSAVETIVPPGYEHQLDARGLAPAVRVGRRAEMDAFVRVRARHLATPPPAQTAVGVAELGVPGALIELRAIAVRGAGSRRR